MSSDDSGRAYPDDLFDHTRMSLGDHIEVLRRHLLRALLGVVLAVAFSFLIGEPVVEFITAPVTEELTRFYHRRIEQARDRLLKGDPKLVAANQPREVELPVHRKRLLAALKLEDRNPEAGEWVAVPVQLRPVDVWTLLGGAEKVVQPPSPVSFTVTEPFVVYFKVCIYCGIVLASPWVFYQLWSFVAAGLYPHERRYVNIFLPFSLGLFLAGVALCEFVVLPKAVEYLLGFNEWMGIEPSLRLSDWLSFATVMPLIFGAAFQTPLVMLFLTRLGILGVDTFRRKRRIALFLLAVLAAVLSPSPDALSMLSLTVPLWGLYELGILLCRLSPPPAPDPELSETEQMVEA